MLTVLNLILEGQKTIFFTCGNTVYEAIAWKLNKYIRVFRNDWTRLSLLGDQPCESRISIQHFLKADFCLHHRLAQFPNLIGNSVILYHSLTLDVGFLASGYEQKQKIAATTTVEGRQCPLCQKSS
jgi:hypothetical protein